MDYTQDIVKINGVYWIQETHTVSELQAHTETVAGPYKTWEDADVLNWVTEELKKYEV